LKFIKTDKLKIVLTSHSINIFIHFCITAALVTVENKKVPVKTVRFNRTAFSWLEMFDLWDSIMFD